MLHELIFENCNHSKDPLISCALEGVASIIAGIKDVAIVIHSPQGCSATVANAYDTHEIDFSNRKVACSRLFETDIIMGATEKLKDLIMQADSTFQTEVIFVVGTCAADIIGEDLEAVCRSLQETINARLIPVMAGGFHGDSYDGMDLALSVLFSLIKPHLLNSTDTNYTGNIPASLENESAVKMQSVNILVPQANLNPTWWADSAWVESVLGRIGVSVKCLLPRNFSLKDLPEIAKAKANILLTHDTGFDFAANLEYSGLKLIMNEVPLPVGIKNTERWLRTLGKYFDAEHIVDDIITEGEKSVQDILRKRGLMIIPRYRNCRVAISADCTIGIPLVRMLFNDLEMIPELLLFRRGSPVAKKILEKELDDLGIQPKVVFDADGYKIKQALQTVEIDAILGSSWEKYIAEELGIKLAFDVLSPTNRDVYIDRAYFGYDGFLNILEVIGNDWEAAYRSKSIHWEQFR